MLRWPTTFASKLLLATLDEASQPRSLTHPDLPRLFGLRLVHVCTPACSSESVYLFAAGAGLLGPGAMLTCLDACSFNLLVC